MPRRWDQITPALYGIARKIAMPTIKDKWDKLIAPVLYTEERLYGHSFLSYAIAYSLGANEACALEIFLTLLKHEGVVFEHQEIPTAVFDAYWDLAGKNDFWSHDGYAKFGQQTDYLSALGIWRSTHQDRIRWCEESLERWLNEN